MSQPMREPSSSPAHAYYTPNGAGRPEDWFGRWTDFRTPSISVHIAGFGGASRKYDIVIRETLRSVPPALLRNTFVLIPEFRSSADVRTLQLPAHGIVLSLYQLATTLAGQQQGTTGPFIRYQRPATAQAAEVDQMLWLTPPA